MDEQLKYMVELFDSPVKEIYKKNGTTIIEFENGKCVPLYGEEITLNYDTPKCSFCGSPSIGKEPLYSPDDKVFICKECAVLAVETFANNGFQINIKVKNFKNIVDGFQKMNEKATNKKE